MLTPMPPADNAQSRPVQHSNRPRQFQTGKRSNMGQILVEKFGLPGSDISENQHHNAKVIPPFLTGGLPLGVTALSCARVQTLLVSFAIAAPCRFAAHVVWPQARFATG